MTRFDLQQLFDLRREIQEDEARLASSDYVDLRDALRIKKLRLLSERKRLIDWIESQSDSFTRRVLMFRFFDGLTWLQIAQRIGGNNTPDSVRMYCNRFLNRILP